jgi:hypothetical protein
MELIDKSELEPLLLATLQPLLAKLLDTAEIRRVEPVLCSVAEAAAMLSRSKRFIDDGIARGLFVGKKSDGRTLLVVQSLKDYAAALPAAKGSLNKIKRKRSQDGTLPAAKGTMNRRNRAAA